MEQIEGQVGGSKDSHGNVLPVQVNSSGDLKADLSTQIAGEDLTNDVLKVEHQYSQTYVAAAGDDNVIKNAPGFLHAIILGKWVTGGTLEVSDHATTGDATIKIKLTAGATDATGFPKTIIVDAVFAVGITADITGLTDITFIWR